MVSSIFDKRSRGDKMLIQLAASSIASGSPPSRWQTSLMVLLLTAVRAYVGAARTARSANRSMASFRIGGTT